MSDLELSAKLDRWIDDNTVDNDFIAHPDFVYDKLLELETEIKKLQAENEQLKKQSQWINKISKPVNNHSDWSIGETAIAINFNSNEPYAFEIEWDGDCWCSIGGDEFTHWMPKPKDIVEA